MNIDTQLAEQLDVVSGSGAAKDMLLMFLSAAYAAPTGAGGSYAFAQ